MLQSMVRQIHCFGACGEVPHHDARCGNITKQLLTVWQQSEREKRDQGNTPSKNMPRKDKETSPYAPFSKVQTCIMWTFVDHSRPKPFLPPQFQLTGLASPFLPHTAFLPIIYEMPLKGPFLKYFQDTGALFSVMGIIYVFCHDCL